MILRRKMSYQFTMLEEKFYQAFIDTRIKRRHVIALYEFNNGLCQVFIKLENQKTKILYSQFLIESNNQPGFTASEVEIFLCTFCNEAFKCVKSLHSRKRTF